jgi:hypothetical protein
MGGGRHPATRAMRCTPPAATRTHSHVRPHPAAVS